VNNITFGSSRENCVVFCLIVVAFMLFGTMFGLEVGKNITIGKTINQEIADSYGSGKIIEVTQPSIAILKEKGLWLTVVRIKPYDDPKMLRVFKTNTEYQAGMFVVVDIGGKKLLQPIVNITAPEAETP